MPVPTPSSELRILGPTVPASVESEETQVADDRAALSPSQQVEQRVIRLLGDSAVLVSQMQRQMNRGAR
jgi:hypothetical protein